MNQPCGWHGYGKECRREAVASSTGSRSPTSDGPAKIPVTQGLDFACTVEVPVSGPVDAD